MRRLSIIAASTFLLFAFGCGVNNDNETREARVNDIDDDRVELDGRTGNQRMDVADGIADRIAVMEEVDHANVIVAGDTAYVSVRLNNHADDKTGQNQNTGTKVGQGNPTGIMNQNGNGNSARNPSEERDMVAPNTNKNQNAVNVNNGNTISSDLERKITQKVKAYDNRIDRVFVTTDSGFYNNMSNYADRIRNGNNTQDLIDDFNDNVRRVFPNVNNTNR
ncbi:YhcN/YlaJ family sporulation lipoprotein [Cytobacillus sp. Hz8]|uniref:YhcN/YlaJ family sporulation lipoprotein n=1 Tax=Cytobacillus sp. Hz8 TaxID=3347168 RepID=UPI0035DD4208